MKSGRGEKGIDEEGQMEVRVELEWQSWKDQEIEFVEE